MTNTPDLLEKIRAKIIEAVPDIKKCNTCGTYKYSSDCFLKHGGQEVVRPIRLADVLLAIEGKARIENSPNNGYLGLYTGEAEADWNLRKVLGIRLKRIEIIV